MHQAKRCKKVTGKTARCVASGCSSMEGLRLAAILFT
jgi:hypothetical protein